MAKKQQPGTVRDAIVSYLDRHGERSVREIIDGVTAALGTKVPPSSVRSYLNLNANTAFIRVERGTYKLRKQ